MAEQMTEGTPVTFREQPHTVFLDTGGSMVVLRSEQGTQVAAFRDEISPVSHPETGGCVVHDEPPSL